MSFLLAAPDALVAAASEIAGIGSSITAANATAAAPTTGLLAAAADEVSTQVAALFSAHAQGYQKLGAQVAVFHDQFVAALNSGSSAYAAAEASAAQSLASAVNAPAAAMLGQPLVGPGSVAGGLASNAVSQIQSAVSGVTGAASVLGSLPTGGAGAVAATGALLGSAAAETAPAAVIPVSLATSIENAYLFFEPYVQYGFELAAWAVGWLPYIGFLWPQIDFLYNLFEPMVQAGLFNILDWLSGTITFAQGWDNFWSATAASINFFIQSEINWIFGFFPPLPPLPVPPP